MMSKTLRDNRYTTAIARQSVDLGFDYKHDIGFAASVLANYQRNRARSSDNNPNENKFIWDMRLSQIIPIWKSITVKCFLNIYNVFNSRYWIDEFYPHPPRYFEGGLTCTF